jgi:hypothetical protein
LNLCSEEFSIFESLRWIVVPQTSIGRWQNYSTKTRQTGLVN